MEAFMEIPMAAFGLGVNWHVRVCDLLASYVG
jgi:hypothetical protein